MAKKQAKPEVTMDNLKAMRTKYAAHRVKLINLVAAAAAELDSAVKENMEDKWEGKAREANLSARNNAERLVQTDCMIGYINQLMRILEQKLELGQGGVTIDEKMFKTNIDGTEDN